MLNFGFSLGRSLNAPCRTNIVAWWAKTFVPSLDQLKDLSTSATHEAMQGQSVLFSGAQSGTVDLTGYAYEDEEVWTIEFEFYNSVAISASTSGEQPIQISDSATQYGVIFGAHTGVIANEILTIRSELGGRSSYVSSSESIATGKHSVVISWDGSGYDIYLDGTQVNNLVDGTEAVLLLSRLVLGSDSTGAALNLDNTSLYNITLKNEAGTVIWQNYLAGGPDAEDTEISVVGPDITWSGFTWPTDRVEDSLGGSTKNNLLGYSKRENLSLYSEPSALAQMDYYGGASVEISSGDFTNYFNYQVSIGDNSELRGMYHNYTNSATLKKVSLWVMMDDGLAPIPSTSTTTGDFSIMINGSRSNDNLTVTHIAGTVYEVSATRESLGSGEGHGLLKYTTQSSRSFKATRFHITEKGGEYARTWDSRVYGGYTPASNMTRWNLSSKLVGLGDSLTNNDWPVYLERLLPNKPVSIIDSGVGGNTISDCYARLQSDVLDYDPDICVLLVGVNDLIANASAIQMETDYQLIIDALIANGITPILVKLTPWGNNADWSSARQTQQDLFNTWLDTTGDIVVDVEDLGDPSNTEELLSVYDSGDGLHMSASGATALADLIEQSLPGSRISVDVTNNPLTYSGKAATPLDVYGWTADFDGSTYATLDSAVTLSGDFKIEFSFQISAIGADQTVFGGNGGTEGFFSIGLDGIPELFINDSRDRYDDFLIAAGTTYDCILIRVDDQATLTISGISQIHEVHTTDFTIRFIAGYGTGTTEQLSGTISYIKFYNSSDTLINHWVLEGRNVATDTQVTIFDVVGGNDATLSGGTTPIFSVASSPSYLARYGGIDDGTDGIIPFGASTNPNSFNGPHDAPEGVIEGEVSVATVEIEEADDTGIFINKTTGAAERFDFYDLATITEYQFVGDTDLLLYSEDISGSCKEQTYDYMDLEYISAITDRYLNTEHYTNLDHYE